MFRKALLVFALALSFFGSAQVGGATDPIPDCNPCPWQK